MPDPQPRSPVPVPRAPALAALDAWVAAHPWHPRVLPFFVYIVLFALLGLADSLDPRLHPLLYAAQCGVVAWLLWRYRRLTPELTLRFHWLAVPVGVFVFVAWVALGWLMAGEFAQRWDALVAWASGASGGGSPLAMIDYPDDAVPRFATDDTQYDTFLETMGPGLGWTTLGLRLLGMSLLVPVFEELFIRSLMLRSLADRRRTWLGIRQALCDVPGLGDWFMHHTRMGDEASRSDPVFGRSFVETPLGRLTVFGVVASTFVFMLSHVPRDWPGIWVCGIAYCLLVGATNGWGRQPAQPSPSDPPSPIPHPPSPGLGLGPVIWAHGLTNALLWVYTVWTGDWQFL